MIASTVNQLRFKRLKLFKKSMNVFYIFRIFDLLKTTIEIVGNVFITLLKF